MVICRRILFHENIPTPKHIQKYHHLPEDKKYSFSKFRNILEVRDIPVIGFAGSAGVVSWETFLIRKAGKRTEGSSSLLLLSSGDGSAWQGCCRPQKLKAFSFRTTGRLTRKRFHRFLCIIVSTAFYSRPC